MDNKDQILGFVRLFSTITLDEDLLDTYYSDVLDDLGKLRDPLLLACELFSVTAGTATYTIPSHAVKPQYIFVGSTQLIPCDLADLESYDDEWRALSDDPWAYTTVEQSENTYQLVSNPDTSSSAFIPTYGEPLGRDYPANTGAWIFSHKRDTDMPEWVSVHIALKILARIYTVPSKYRDTRFAEQCDKFADLLLTSTGVR